MFRRSIIIVAALALAGVAAVAPVRAKEPDMQDLVRNADHARGGDLPSGVSLQCTITSFKDGAMVRSYSVSIEGQGRNSLATFTAPTYSRGTKMLVRERNMWFLSEELKRPVPISPRQRLLGDASNGDIATANLSDDYTAKLIGNKEIDGEPCFVIELRPKSPDVTYDRIVYYIGRGSGLGLRAEFYTVSGMLFKSADMSYGNQLNIGGRQIRFISRMVIQDAVQRGNETILVYSNPKAEDIPASRFDIRNLMGD